MHGEIVHVPFDRKTGTYFGRSRVYFAQSGATMARNQHHHQDTEVHLFKMVRVNADGSPHQDCS